MDTTDASSSSAGPSSAPPVAQMAPSKNGRTAGKAHKSSKAPVRRSYISEAIKTPFEKRMEAEKKKQAIKGVEKDMKEEMQAEKDRKVNIIRERRERAAEKARMEAMATKMSAKKLQRLRKRQGRTKKISG